MGARAAIGKRVKYEIAQDPPPLTGKPSVARYEAIARFMRRFDFDPEAEDYLIHITTGTHVAQICLFLLTEGLAVLHESGPGAGRNASSLFDAWARYDQHPG